MFLQAYLRSDEINDTVQTQRAEFKSIKMTRNDLTKKQCTTSVSNGSHITDYSDSTDMGLTGVFAAAEGPSAPVCVFPMNKLILSHTQ